MTRTHNPGSLLAALVWIHLVAAAIHGRAHAGAAVDLSMAGNLFVWTVILAAPLVGLWLTRSRPVEGGWVVAAAMTGSLVFGLVNHFVLDSPDHVSRVQGEWHAMFTSTAILIAIIEAAGAAAGVWYAGASKAVHS